MKTFLLKFGHYLDTLRSAALRVRRAQFHNQRVYQQHRGPSSSSSNSNIKVTTSACCIVKFLFKASSVGIGSCSVTTGVNWLGQVFSIKIPQYFSCGRGQFRVTCNYEQWLLSWNTSSNIQFAKSGFSLLLSDPVVDGRRESGGNFVPSLISLKADLLWCYI